MKFPVLGAVLPIAEGEANVFPFNNAAFRFGFTVVLVAGNGAVPVATVDVNLLPETASAVLTVAPSSEMLELANPCAPPEPFGSTLLVTDAADVVHVGHDIAGVAPPVEAIGVEPVTAVTVPPAPEP